MNLKFKKYLKTTKILFCASLFLLYAGLAQAEKGKGEGLVLTCGSCHGSQGSSSAIPAIPVNSEALKIVLKSFKSGKTKSLIMGRLMKGYTDEEIEMVAKKLGK